MAETSGRLAHQFDDLKQQHEASTLGMWIFLATEVMFFGGLFAGYLAYRYWYPEAFAVGSRHLDLTLGTVNTAVLLLSSLTMALAVRGAQTGRPRVQVGYLLATMLLGCVFLAIKALEYSHKFEEHLVPGAHFSLGNDTIDGGSPQSELFFSFYFTMTGVHALHLVIGVIAVACVTVFAWRGRLSSEYFTPIEMTGLYWHLVDIIWVFLFPLLYLIDQSR